MSNQAVMVVTYEALINVLGIPKDVGISALVQDPDDTLRNQVRILLKHPSLPVHYEAEEPRQYNIEEIKKMVNS